jgi:two-component system, OmpR family, response regulator ResD
MDRKLLVIDNHRDVADAISSVAGSLDFEVLVVDDSRRAVGIFVDFAPDLVILDVVMRGVDGVDVLNGLIASGLRALIVLSASPGIGEAYLRIAQGVARFNGFGPLPVLQKPPDMARLREVLAQVPPTA